MSARPEPSKELNDLLKKHGKIVRTNGKHIIWEVGGARFRMVKTPSEYRGAANQVQRGRRILREVENKKNNSGGILPNLSFA